MPPDSTTPSMRSDTIKKGDARAGHRSLLRATGVGRGGLEQAVHRHL